jgi:hypothetical protein
MSGMGGKELLAVASRDAMLATRHAYVLLTARTRISRPVLETAQTLSVPVVRKPFDLEALLMTVAQAQKRLEADGSTGREA